MIRELARVDVVPIDSRCARAPRRRFHETLRDMARSVVGAMALLVLGLGVTRAAVRFPSARSPSADSHLSGTILAANAHQLLVATARGERVVLTLESHTVGRWDGASSMTVARGIVAPALRDVARNAATLVGEPPELLPWTSSGPLILPILGLFAIGTAGGVAIGRHISSVFTPHERGEQCSTRSQLSF